MGKFNSDWIEGNTFYRQIGVGRESGVPRFERCERPLIVCLCGSCRFRDEFIRQNAKLTMEGKIVLSVGFYVPFERREITDAEKTALDELHKRKIDLADEVLVVNPKCKICKTCKKPCELFIEPNAIISQCCGSGHVKDSYYGESTASEIAYALKRGKVVSYLTPPAEDK